MLKAAHYSISPPGTKLIKTISEQDIPPRKEEEKRDPIFERRIPSGTMEGRASAINMIKGFL